MAQNYYVTPSPQTSRFSKKVILIGGGLIAAIILAIVLLSSGGGNPLSKQLQHLSLRMTSLQQLLESPEVDKNLKNAELSQITTELKLTLTTSTNELAPIMTEAGLPPKFDKDIVTSETDTSTALKLEDAALNNRFNEAYGETLTQKITSLRALVLETYNLTKNAKLRQALVNLDNTLGSAQKSIDKLTF